MADIQKGAIGVRISATVKEGGQPVDLTGVTTKDFIFKKPNGTTIRRAAVFAGASTDGVLVYTTVEDDLDIAGHWQLQADLVFPGGYDGPTDIGTFKVQNNLE